MRTLTILAVLAALLLAAPTPGRAEEGARISVVFEDAEAADVFANLAAFGGANLVVSPKVKGRITLKLAGVPWRHALETVAKSLGARVIQEPHGILRVVPKGRDPKANEWRADRGRAEKAAKGGRRADAARVNYAALLERLQDARRRLDGQRDGGAGPDAMARTEAEIKELEAHTDRLRAKLVDVERETAVAKSMVAELEAERLRSEKARDDLVREYGVRARRSPPKKKGSRYLDPLKRAEHLERAAESLLAAGLAEEAAKTLVRARAMRAAARRDHGRGEYDLVGSVNALRGDVRALREQVAELTHLVRRLIETRRAPPKSKRGGGIWVPGRGGRGGGPGEPGEPGTAGKMR